MLNNIITAYTQEMNAEFFYSDASIKLSSAHWQLHQCSKYGQISLVYAAN